MRWVGEFLIYLVIAVLVVTLVKNFLVQPYQVPSGSMEQTLQINDYILAWKPGAPERGEIVVFRDDLDWLGPAPAAPEWKKVLSWVKILPPQNDQYLVKRLIGLPGDHVTCCNTAGQITVNGKALDESQYEYFSDQAMAQIPFDIVVPQGHIFVLGDHRDSSEDSRYHMCNGNTPTPQLTFPSIDSIQGKVVAVVKPLKRMQTFKIPSVFDSVPPPTGTPPDPGTAQWACT